MPIILVLAFFLGLLALVNSDSPNREPYQEDAYPEPDSTVKHGNKTFKVYKHNK